MIIDYYYCYHAGQTLTVSPKAAHFLVLPPEDLLQPVSFVEVGETGHSTHQDCWQRSAGQKTFCKTFSFRHCSVFCILNQNVWMVPSSVVSWDPVNIRAEETRPPRADTHCFPWRCRPSARSGRLWWGPGWPSSCWSRRSSCSCVRSCWLGTLGCLLSAGWCSLSEEDTSSRLLSRGYKESSDSDPFLINVCLQVLRSTAACIRVVWNISVAPEGAACKMVNFLHLTILPIMK